MKTQTKCITTLFLLLFPLIISEGVVPMYIEGLPSLSSGKPSTSTSSTMPSDRNSFIAMQREAFEASKDLYIDMGIIPEKKDELVFTNPYQERVLAIPEQHIPPLSRSAEPTKSLPRFQDFAPLFIANPNTRNVNVPSSPILALANHSPSNHVSAGGSIRPSTMNASSPASTNANAAGSSGSNVSGSSGSAGQSSNNESSPSDSASEPEATQESTGSDISTAQATSQYSSEADSVTATETETETETENNKASQANNGESSSTSDNNTLSSVSGETNAEQRPSEQPGNSNEDNDDQVANPEMQDTQNDSQPSSNNVQTAQIFETMSNAQTPPSVILVNEPVNQDTPRANKIMQTIIPEPSTLWLFVLLPFLIWLTSSKRHLLDKT